MKNLKDLKLVQKYFQQSSPFITTYTGLHKKSEVSSKILH